MADLTTRIQNWIAARLAGATVKKIVAGCVAALTAAIVAGWTFMWHHFNPQFEYQTQPSSLPSHFVGVGQVLSQIEKDSQLYCTGGWDQRLAEFGLRKCYHFRFDPPGAYRLLVCMHDPRTISIATTDQLLALQHFEQAFKPRQCFATLPQTTTNDYVVSRGKDAKVVTLQYGTDAPQDTAFCDCSESEIDAIAVAVGAKRN